MRDDHLQGILFNRSSVIRFREVPMPPKGLVSKAREKSRTHVLDPLSALLHTRSKEIPAAELGDFIDYVVTQEIS
jgi:hypothetical protein